MILSTAFLFARPIRGLILKRLLWYLNQITDNNTTTFRYTIMVDGSPVHLTPIEYKIIVLLSQNVGKVLTHDHMLRYLWGSHASDSQVLRVNVANIRRKIEKNSADPEYIVTEVGVGYRMMEIGEV